MKNIEVGKCYLINVARYMPKDENDFVLVKIIHFDEPIYYYQILRSTIRCFRENEIEQFANKSKMMTDLTAITNEEATEIILSK